MLLGNVPKIIRRNYASLVNEVGYRGNTAKVIVAVLLGGIPLLIGLFLGFYSPLWTGLVSALISTMGVLTGFSLNAVILLTGHSEEDGYELKTRVVNQTKDFALYSVFVGITLLAVLIIGFVTAKAGPIFTLPNPGGLPAISILQGVSVLVYGFLVHYLVILLVIVHRLYSLIHGNAL